MQLLTKTSEEKSNVIGRYETPSLGSGYFDQSSSSGYGEDANDTVRIIKIFPSAALTHPGGLKSRTSCQK